MSIRDNIAAVSPGSHETIVKSNHPHPGPIALFVHRPVAVSMFYAAVALLGAVSLLRLPVDLLPDLSYPRLTVWTVYPGTARTVVETSVTVPGEGIRAGVPPEG